MRDPQRVEDSSHWILVDENARASKHPDDQGWRLHVDLPDDEGYFDLVEEQVLPERVERADANRIRRSNGIVRLNLDEARWLNALLVQIIPELARREVEGNREVAENIAARAGECAHPLELRVRGDEFSLDRCGKCHEEVP